MAEILLEAKNLKKSFRSRENKTAYMHAVQDVSFQIEKGECLGLIGSPQAPPPRPKAAWTCRARTCRRSAWNRRSADLGRSMP